MSLASQKTRAFLRLDSAKLSGLLLFAVLTLLTVLPANAAPGVLIANTVTSPLGMAWVPDAAGGHMWVADGALGVCRLDPGGPGGTFLLTRCDIQVKSPAQMAFARQRGRHQLSLHCRPRHPEQRRG
jgi:hypothetical protein